MYNVMNGEKEGWCRPALQRLAYKAIAILVEVARLNPNCVPDNTGICC
jgi:hypothetical protein